MKRAPFLVAAAGAALTGCGGSRVTRALPGVASSQQNHTTTAAHLVPSAADPIPANVLASPIIGEAWRFDGPTAPSGWILAQGQTLDTAQYSHLVSVLRNVTGRGSATFTLPKYPFGVIIAAAGQFPTSPAVFAQSGRKITLTASLGPGAVPVTVRRLPARAQAALDARTAALDQARRQLSAAPKPARTFDAPISPELAARIVQSRADARASAFERVSPTVRSRADALVEAMVSGGLSTHDAQMQMASALSSSDANALLEVHDAHVRAFRPGWPGMSHPDPVAEAARFAIDIAITPDQERALAHLPRYH